MIEVHRMRAPTPSQLARAGGRVAVIIAAFISSSSCGGTPGISDTETELVRQGVERTPDSNQKLQYGNCRPFTDDEVCVCTDYDGKGDCFVLDLQTRFYASLGNSTLAQRDVTGKPVLLRDLRDKISSIRTGARVWARLYGDSGFASEAAGLDDAYNGWLAFHTIAPGTTYDRLPDQGYGPLSNDQASSIRLTPIDYDCHNLKPGEVGIFTEVGFHGDCVVLRGGNYYRPDTNPTVGDTGGGFGLARDSIRSVKLGPNTKVFLFDNVQPASELPGCEARGTCWDWSPPPLTICNGSGDCQVRSSAVGNLWPYDMQAKTSAISVVADPGPALEVNNYGNCPPFGPLEACVCEHHMGGGVCKILDLKTRFYADLATFTVGGLDYLENEISSVATGSGVRLRVHVLKGFGAPGCPSWPKTRFLTGKDDDGGPNPNQVPVDCPYSALTLPEGTIVPNMKTPLAFRPYDIFGDSISSMALEPVGEDCNKPGPGEVALWGKGDCVVLPADHDYYRADANPWRRASGGGLHGGGFGLEDNSITHIRLGHHSRVRLFDAAVPLSTYKTCKNFLECFDWSRSISICNNGEDCDVRTERRSVPDPSGKAEPPIALEDLGWSEQASAISVRKNLGAEN